MTSQQHRILACHYLARADVYFRSAWYAIDSGAEFVFRLWNEYQSLVEKFMHHWSRMFATYRRDQ
jgi:hypothetical protein